jgi:high-affinity nickel-transport protein
LSLAVLAVFVVGLRHGADPDHLAAIDNLTRNANDRMPRASRFVGSLFAVGHSAMVILTAVAAAALGARIGHISEPVERAGELASIGVLLLMAGLNITTLMRGGSTTLRSRLLPKTLRDATHPLVAIPIGALFGLGFETSSQLVAYGTAFSSTKMSAGLLIGAVFCLGMICTDTLDSLLVARVVTTNGESAQHARRWWIIAVTLVALAVAGEEIMTVLGYPPPFDEITLSAITVVLLGATAISIGFGRRISASRRAAVVEVSSRNAP